MKETVTVEKNVYDILQKNNLDLMEKLLLFGWLGNGSRLFKGD